MGPKGRLHPRGPSRKSSSSTFIFSMLIICLFFILILLALGILSIPTNSINYPKANDLSSIVQQVTDAARSVIFTFRLICCRDLTRFIFGECRSEVSDGRVDHWVEVISWEPRAVIYHNFLVSIVFIEDRYSGDAIQTPRVITV
ncbi:putative procollagen-proline 4-dioxygenase [Helianthus annuus]|nr:putative procollagen-proline 4-dioxygenase [Helianthus annuus]